MSSYIPVKKGTDPSPQTGAPNPVRVSGGPDAATDAGREVELRYSGTIQSWVNAQRQNVANSTTDVHTANLNHPDFDAHYRNVQGTEHVTVSPKPKPLQGGLTPEPLPEPVPTTPKLKELVNDTEDHTDACLMVLYLDKDPKTQEQVGFVAAIPMTSLSTTGDGPAVTYQGQSKDSKWVKEPGRLLTTMQAKLGGTSFILWPTDITGADTPKKLYLSTTELGDDVATDGDPGGMPLLNGNAQLVYTTGGAFSFSKEQGFRLTKKLYTGAENAGYGGGTAVEVPHAIASDGTCYINAYLGSSMLVAISPQTASGVNYQATPGMYDQLSDKRKEVNDQLSKVTYYTGSVILFLTSTTDNDTFHTYTKSVFNTAGDGYHVALPNEGLATIPGESYYGRAAFGQAAQLTNYQHAEGSVDYYSYTGGDDGHAVVTAFGIGNLLDNKVPLMNYTASGAGGDTFGVTLVNYTANELDHNVMTEDTSAKKYVVGAGVLTFQGDEKGGGYYQIENPNQHGLFHSRTFSVYGYGPGATPPKYTDPNDPFYTEEEVRDYYKQMQAGLQKEGAILTPVSFTDLGGRTEGDATGSTGSTHGDYTSTDSGDDGEENFPPGIEIVSVSASQGDHELYFSISYSLLHWILAYPTKSKQTITANVSLFGETQTATQTGDEPPGTIPNANGFIVHAFPPMYQGKSWYEAVSGTYNAPQYKLVTPYKTHASVSTGLAQFRPWLHVSNGKHVLQGYYTDGEGYLHLDGSNQNYLPLLAKAIGCPSSSIVSMVMDITLKKIKAVEGVKPPDYSGSATGDPGIIAKT